MTSVLDCEMNGTFWGKSKVTAGLTGVRFGGKQEKRERERERERERVSNK